MSLGAAHATPACTTRPARPSRAASTHLRSLQHPDGYWWGELESNATIIAEHVFMLHLFGLATDDLRRRLGNELLATQRDDGVVGASGTAARPTSRRRSRRYYALRLCGIPADDPRMRPRAGGGAGASAAPTGRASSPSSGSR